MAVSLFNFLKNSGFNLYFQSVFGRDRARALSETAAESIHAWCPLFYFVDVLLQQKQV